MSVESVWKRQRMWSALATAKAANLEAWRRRNLVLVVAGAVCGALATLAPLLPPVVATALGLVGAVALAVAAVVQNTQLNAERVQDRVKARAAAEVIKSAVYQYLVRVPPYAGADRDDALDAVTREVTLTVENMAGEAVAQQVDERPAPRISGIADYVALRAREQRSFHADRIAHHQRLGNRWRIAELTATIIAAILSAVGGTLEGTQVSVWVGVATTVAAALAAHRAGAQHARIAATYGITVDDLNRLIDRFDPVGASEAEAAEFVARVEAVLAGQNDSWVTTLTRQH